MQWRELLLVTVTIVMMTGCQREFGNRNLAQLRSNMTQKEVESILGNPDRTEKVELELPAELQARIDETITQYPVSKRSAILPLLHLIQEHAGYIEDEAVLWIATKLDVKPINVLELVTFYPMF